MKEEFVSAINQLVTDGIGIITNFKTKKHSQTSTIFVKKPHEAIIDQYNIDRQEYQRKFSADINKLISPAMLEAVIKKGLLTDEHVFTPRTVSESSWNL